MGSPDDQERIAQLREGDDIPDMIQDARTLAAMIRPRRAEIVDPEFRAEWVDEAITLAGEVEAARAGKAAETAANPSGQQMRRVRDTTVAQLQELVEEVRDHGKHAFRKDKKLREVFASEALRQKRQKRARKAAKATPPPGATPKPAG